MVNWRNLSHAYGSAADIPELLARLSPHASDDLWEDLWSRLCHQGTVYSASFAALPALEAAAREWRPSSRIGILGLAGAIVASDCVSGERDEFMRGLDGTIARLEGLALESAAQPGWSRNELIYLFQAVLAFRGDRLWGQQLEGLVDGELQGTCPFCRTELYLVIGEDGFFTTDEWISRPETATRIAIEPRVAAFPPVGSWLREQALAAQQPELTELVGYLFGATRCPRCGQSFSVPDAVAAT